MQVDPKLTLPAFNCNLRPSMKDSAEDEIHGAFREAAEDLNTPAEKVLKLEHNNMHGWFLRLTKKDETTVRKKLSASYHVLEVRALQHTLVSTFSAQYTPPPVCTCHHSQLTSPSKMFM